MNIFLKRGDKSGDTIIEVMLAMTLLTSFLFIAWGITNRSAQMGINSRKRIEMVNAMKEQAEIIKAQYASGGYKVDNLISSVQATTLGLDKNPCDPDGVTMSNVFYFTGSATGVHKETNKKSQPDADNSIWVQYMPEAGTDPQYYDFYIRSCWQTTGSSQNTDSSQFVVRLNKQQGPVIPKEPPTILNDTWTIAFEESALTGASVSSSDFNDFVLNVNVTETYIDIGPEKYLEKIEMRFTPRHVGHEANNDIRFKIVLGVNADNQVVPCYRNGNPSPILTDFMIYQGARPTIQYQLIENGIPVNDGSHGFVNKHPYFKPQMLYVFQDTRNTMNTDGSIRQEGVVTFSNFARVPGNTLSARSYPNFPGMSTIKPNFRRYPIRFIPYKAAGGSWYFDGSGEMSGSITDASEALYNGFLWQLTTKYPAYGVFIPADNWSWPSEGEELKVKYPGYDTYHIPYLGDQCGGGNRNDFYYDEEPVLNGKMWWQL